MRTFRVPLLICFLFFGAAHSGNHLFAQSELTRVSVAERSDGEGYVLRYHLTQSPDSFLVAMPSVNLVQLKIYGSRMMNESIPVGENDELANIGLVDIENGVGSEISLNESVFFVADAYPDMNGTDLLLALEYASEDVVRASLTENLLFKGVNEESSETGLPEEETEDEVVEQEEPEEPEGAAPVEAVLERSGDKRVTVGVVAGISMADVKGSAFVSEVRRGTSFGLALGVNLPWQLPLRIGTGIETGFYYAQKGFKNPSPDFLNAETIEFDYIEIPLLAKFSYPLIERVSPYILAGPSIGFNVSAERVRSDESRADLDDQTKAADLSLVLGGGLDVDLNRQVLSIRARGGLSFSDVFNTNAGSSPTDFFKHRYIALELVLRL